MATQSILVVDDDPKILKLLEVLLSQQGYLVVLAQSGAEAIAKAQGEALDLIIMDVVLPDINGAEAAQTILGQNKNPNAPVIFLTGMITKKEQEDCHLVVNIKDMNYCTYAKPIDQAAFLKSVRNLLVE